MKRSEINKAIIEAKNRLDEYKITLPMFAYWSEEEWKKNSDKISRIRERMLGWDVSDFGSGDFSKCGAVLFTVRNGDKNDKTLAAPYAEKYILLDDKTEQEIPYHYHVSKTEDIINRGGGVMVVHLYNSTADDKLDEEKDVVFYMDCIKYTVKPGEPVYVMPGNSITIEPYVFHKFYPQKDKGFLIVGEVSKVNDDNCDNIFLVKSQRYCEIEEDEKKIYPLCNEY